MKQDITTKVSKYGKVNVGINVVFKQTNTKCNKTKDLFENSIKNNTMALGDLYGN